MNAEFKCQECGKIFYQSLEHFGLMVGKCHYCSSVYMDCQNLEECLKWCKEKDEENDRRRKIKGTAN